MRHTKLMTTASEIRFQAAGRDWVLRRTDIDELWEHMDDESNPLWKEWLEDGRLPYWAELWPSSLALTAWLKDHGEEIAGKHCLDMGCGLGLTALTGQWQGARVIGMDYDEEALRYARINEQLNGIEGVDWQCMDWRKPTIPAHSLDLIWAGDIVYEEAFAEPVAAFMDYALKENGKAWIAEPGRKIFHFLPDALPSHHLKSRKLCTNPTWPLTKQAVPVPVSIWEITR